MQLAVARDAIVELPDGSELEAADGLVVPNGSVIRTGPDGRVEAGGAILGPDAVGVVLDERLHVTPVEDDPPAAPPPTTDASPTPVVDASPAPVVVEASPAPRPSP